MVERRCIVKRHADETDQLLRFVLDPQNVVVPDLKTNLPGRGVWVTAEKKYLTEAVEKKLFSRAFKTKCQVQPDLADRTEKRLEEHCLNYISLSKKAGQIITGFEKISNALSKDNVALLIQTIDGAIDGQSKLEKKYNAACQDARIEKLFSSEQMNLALGGANVIHAAITRGTMTPGILAAIEKLVKFRGRLT